MYTSSLFFENTIVRKVKLTLDNATDQGFISSTWNSSGHSIADTIYSLVSLFSRTLHTFKLVSTFHKIVKITERKNTTSLCFPIFSRVGWLRLWFTGVYRCSPRMLTRRDHRLTSWWFDFQLSKRRILVNERVGTAWGPHSEGPQPEQAAERRSIYHQVSAPPNSNFSKLVVIHACSSSRSWPIHSFPMIVN